MLIDRRMNKNYVEKNLWTKEPKTKSIQPGTIEEHVDW